MRTIPWEHTFEIHTDLSREGALQRLRREMGPRDRGEGAEHGAFRGEATKDGFDVKEAADYLHGLFPLFHGTFQGNDTNLRIRVRATNGVSLFAVVFAWSASLVMFYQTFFSIVAEKGTVGDAAPFLFQGLLYVGLSAFISAFYWRNVRRGEMGLRRLLGEE